MFLLHGLAVNQLCLILYLSKTAFSFFFFFNNFIYLFLAVLGLCCCEGFFPSCSERELLSSHDVLSSHFCGFSCWGAQS